MCGVSFKLALENQDSVNLTYPWRLMELDCLAYGKGIEPIDFRRNRICGQGDKKRCHHLA